MRRSSRLQNKVTKGLEIQDSYSENESEQKQSVVEQEVNDIEENISQGQEESNNIDIPKRSRRLASVKANQAIKNLNSNNNRSSGSQFKVIDSDKDEVITISSYDEDDDFRPSISFNISEKNTSKYKTRSSTRAIKANNNNEKQIVTKRKNKTKHGEVDNQTKDKDKVKKNGVEIVSSQGNESIPTPESSTKIYRKPKNKKLKTTENKETQKNSTDHNQVDDLSWSLSSEISDSGNSLDINESISDTADSSDVPLVQTTWKRRNNKTRKKHPRGPNGEYLSLSYLRTHPTQDPRVLEHHPDISNVWENVDAMPVIDAKPADQPANLKLKLLPFQKEGLFWMREQEKTEFGGGILADEMGMGKTIQTIALLLSEPRKKTTLLVAPTVALMQWSNEINKHTSGLKTLLYYGTDRTKSTKELGEYDVVLTTYNIIESGFRKQNYGFRRKGEIVKEDSPLHKMEWHRVILDEGHYIKDRSCNTARATFALNTKHKWALTGTPLQNRVGELYSLIRFLAVDPFGYYFCKECDCKSLNWKFRGNSSCLDCGHSPMKHFCWWNTEIMKPIQNYGDTGEGKIAFEKLNKILDRIMLRRTKVERADDLGLPPKIVSVRRDVFNEEEEDMYESLYSDSKRKFNTYIEEGTVLNHYANIFELITKMRLAVNHPDLILKRIPTVNANSNSNNNNNNNNNNLKNRLICGICQDEPEDPILSKCKHVFCREDIRQFLESCIEDQPKCPTCFTFLTIDLSQPTISMENDEGNDQSLSNQQQIAVSGEAFRGNIVNRIDIKKWRSSTKIEALVEELHQLRSQDHTIKSIVFSQFVNFLDLVNWRLHRAGFACCRLDGRMRPAQRDAIIKTFMERHEFTVFLISLKAGGIALNLTEASRVFICDPWWNPAVEDQAMDRIHRLGQHRPIHVTRLIVENSIESRILQLQAKKHALFQSTIGKDTSALSKLTEEDLKFLFVS